MRANGVRRDKMLLAGVLAVALALVLGILADNFQMVAHAATGTISADSVRVRKDASTSSEMVGSLTKGVTVTVNAVKDGTDGHKWYQIEAEGISGYVRDDLISVSGEVGGDTGTGTGTDTPPAAPTVTVTPVQPLNATVTGGQAVRVRSDADANANNIIAQLAQGTAVTVTGQAASADGTTWYQVTFDNNGTQAQGFIRSEYVDLGGATVVPQDQSQAPETPPEESQPSPDEGQNDAPSDKPYDVAWVTDLNGENEGWWFLDIANNQKYPIDKVLQAIQGNSVTAVEKTKELEKTVSTQKTVIIIMVVVLIIFVLAGTLLIFKMKDMSDQAYFSAVEKQTIRERNEIRKERGREGQSTAPRRTVPAQGEGSRSGASGRTVTPGASRPAGTGAQRPAGSQSRPASGQPRPAGAGTNQSRPSGQSRPAGQTAGAPARQGSQTRTSSSGQGRPVAPSGQGQTEGSGRPAGSQVRSASGQGQAVRQDRPTRPGSAPQSSGETSRPQARPSQATAQRPAQSSRPKTNAPVEEDDDLEFEFLNWDGEDNT